MAEDHSEPTFNCPFQRELGTFETEIKNIGTDIKEVKELVKRQNGRIGKLESWRDRLIGAWGIIVLILIPIAVGVIKTWLSKQ